MIYLLFVRGMYKWVGGLFVIGLLRISLPVMSQNIIARFCELGSPEVIDRTSVTLVQTGTTPPTLCVDLINNTTRDVQFHLNFVDAGRIDGGWFCQGENVQEQLGQYVTGYDEITPVAAGETRRITPAIDLPSYALGTYRGCITYYEQQDQQETERGGMDMIVRTAHRFTVRVDRPVQAGLAVDALPLSGEQLLTIPERALNVRQYNNQLQLGFSVTNTGNIAQQLSGTITIGGLIGGEKKQFRLSPVRLLPGEVESVQAAFPVTGTILPVGIALLHVNISHSPQTDTLPDGVRPTSPLAAETITSWGLVWSVPTWRMLLILLGLVLLIFLIRWIRFQRQLDREIAHFKKKQAGEKDEHAANRK